MQFSQIKEEIRSIPFITLRIDADDYFEAVVLNTQILDLTSMLEKFFNLPIWPSRHNLPPRIKKVIADFGGITRGQTLYFFDDENCCLFVMLWPWGDGKSTTVKIIKR